MMALVDGFDVAETPRCPTDGVLLGKVDGGWEPGMPQV